MFTIVMPAYNEENAISDTICRCNKIIEAFGTNESELIIIDDGSTDATFETASKLCKKVIKHPQNMGYGRSLKDGILAASNEIIIITDSDGTYPIEEIPKLLDQYKQGFNMVVGAREGKYYEPSSIKKISRKILKFLVEFTGGKKIEDINSGLRIFSKQEVLKYFDTLCDTFSFTTSLTLAYIMTGKYVKYVPIKYDKRIGKTKVKIFRDTLRTMQFIIEAILYYNPIKIYLVFTIILFIISFFNLVVAYFSKLKIAYILGIGSIIIGILMFGLGLLSIQLKQILQTIKEKNDI